MHLKVKASSHLKTKQLNGSLAITVPLWPPKYQSNTSIYFHFYRKLPSFFFSSFFFFGEDRKLPSSLAHIPQFYSLLLMVPVFWYFVSCLTYHPKPSSEIPQEWVQPNLPLSAEGRNIKSGHVVLLMVIH